MKTHLVYVICGENNVHRIVTGPITYYESADLARKNGDRYADGDGLWPMEDGTNRTYFNIINGLDKDGLPHNNSFGNDFTKGYYHFQMEFVSGDGKPKKTAKNVSPPGYPGGGISPAWHENDKPHEDGYHVTDRATKPHETQIIIMKWNNCDQPWKFQITAIPEIKNGPNRKGRAK